MPAAAGERNTDEPPNLDPEGFTNIGITAEGALMPPPPALGKDFMAEFIPTFGLAKIPFGIPPELYGFLTASWETLLSRSAGSHAISGAGAGVARPEREPSAAALRTTNANDMA